MRSGMALLVVLFIVMAITVLSYGFLARSDVELACGDNMILKTQMDYLAESGLEHARGLILHPQEIEIASGSWAVTQQQLVSGSNDFYNVNVVKDVNGECNYKITCDAYREKGNEHEHIGQSSLKAELRLNPCIAFWTAADSTISANTTINGDVYCGGSFTNPNHGVINGDVFAVSFPGTGPTSGQKCGIEKAVGVTNPGLNISNFTPYYPTPADGNVVISQNLTVNDRIVVDCNLVINGGIIKITAPKNSPALLVGNKLTLKNGAVLEVNGFAQTANGLSVDGGTEVKISGSLFIVGTGGINGAGKVTITTDPLKASLQIPAAMGGPITWSPAAGAFFKSIERK